MPHILWIVPVVIGTAAIYRPRLLSVALLAMLICGLIWLGRLVLDTHGSSVDRPADDGARAEQNRDFYSVQRDIPPST